MLAEAFTQLFGDEKTEKTRLGRISSYHFILYNAKAIKSAKLKEKQTVLLQKNYYALAESRFYKRRMHKHCIKEGR